MTRTPKNSRNEKDFTKRRSVAEGLKLTDAAHAATWRLYCDVFSLWRGCSKKKCRRNRRCLGEPAACLLRALPFIPPVRREAAVKEVIAGGPRRLPPSTHLEWTVRREPLPRLMTWRLPPGEA
jgi:hypothetical protein